MYDSSGELRISCTVASAVSCLALRKPRAYTQDAGMSIEWLKACSRSCYSATAGSQSNTVSMENPIRKARNNVRFRCPVLCSSVSRCVLGFDSSAESSAGCSQYRYGRFFRSGSYSFLSLFSSRYSLRSHCRSYTSNSCIWPGGSNDRIGSQPEQNFEWYRGSLDHIPCAYI